ELAFRRAGADLSAGELGHALGLVLLGAALGSLLLDCARALALTACARPGQPWLAAGLSRVPALITGSAVELPVQGVLLVGPLVVLPRVVEQHSALSGALVCAPALFLSLILFAAARMGLVLAARGVRPAAALAHGFDVALRRMPSLGRLAAAVLVYTL